MTSWPDHLPSGNQKRAAGRKAIQRMRREAGDDFSCIDNVKGNIYGRVGKTLQPKAKI